MAGVLGLLGRNPNYRNTWLAQVVSETGDYFNNIAVFALVMEKSGSGMVVSGVMLSRAIPAVLAGPVAGVVLDRFDRRRVMIASDLVRAAVAAAFLWTVPQSRPWLLYVLSAGLMFASPFFTSGRSAILPSITGPEELDAANALTQTTSWATASTGALLAGFSAARFGYEAAFIINALSFVFSAWCISGVRGQGSGAGARESVAAGPDPGAGFWGPGARGQGSGLRPLAAWALSYREGLGYMRSVPLMMGIALITTGWAMGGGAAQILFALFGGQVFHRGAAGIGSIWGFAGIGLLIGGPIGHLTGRRASFSGYKRTVTISYLLHGAAYMLFSQAPSYGLALMWMLLSRVGMAVTSILNQLQLLRHTPDQFRGRVFATMESLRWSMMIVSMAAAGIASQWVGPRTIGLIAGALGLVTAIAWACLDGTGRLPEP